MKRDNFSLSTSHKQKTVVGISPLLFNLNLIH